MTLVLLISALAASANGPRGDVGAHEAQMRVAQTGAATIDRRADEVADGLQKSVGAAYTQIRSSQLALWDELAEGQALPILAAWSALIAAALLGCVAGFTVLRTAAKPNPPKGDPGEPAATTPAEVQTGDGLSRSAVEFAAAQRRLAVIAERERFADDLRARPVHEVFALSLALSSAASRHPEMAELFTALIEQTDRIIAQLREVVVDVGGAAERTPQLPAPAGRGGGGRP